MRRALVLLLLLPCAALAAEAPLNFSSKRLPRQLLDGEARKILEEIGSAAEAARVLDRPCVVDSPMWELFLPADYSSRRVLQRDSSAAFDAKLQRDENQERAAEAKAERLWRALWRTSPYIATEGLAAQKQVPTSLRRILSLAVSTASGVRPEAQTWIRSDARLQSALGAVFAAPQAFLASAPRSPASADFAAALPALDFLLNRTSARPSEDALRALDSFVQKYSP